MQKVNNESCLISSEDLRGATQVEEFCSKIPSKYKYLCSELSLPGWSWDISNHIENLKRARIFVIDTMIEPSLETLKDNLSLPFKTCFFETFPKPHLLSFMDDAGVGPSPTFSYATLIHEEAPYKYSGFVAVLRVKEGKLIPSFYDDAMIVEDMAKHFVRELQKGKFASEVVKWKVRIGKGKKREQIKIRDIVRVVSKKATRETIRSIYGGNIDWTHRWEVMGHWRKINGMGKDRSGSYCVTGMTWVTDHTKGPENKVLVKKTRFVQDPARTHE